MQGSLEMTVKRIGNAVGVLLLVLTALQLLFRIGLWLWVNSQYAIASSTLSVFEVSAVLIILTLACSAFLLATLMSTMWQQRHWRNGLKLTLAAFVSLALLLVAQWALPL
ncbi:MAG: hypothetical protein HWE13_03505 [Gammaproteobacteria bacterium]|nr:hypothetical protein [Gammaproteobacteria bacterium]NVK87160.1 hypothetical protein [Gammaproteobacteria bacterium]